jgi:hypothetical protein
VTSSVLTCEIAKVKLVVDLIIFFLSVLIIIIVVIIFPDKETCILHVLRLFVPYFSWQKLAL